MPSQTARRLRAVMTDVERRLWTILRSRQFQGFKFRRQHPVGPFVLDFACVAHRLVIEVDGGQHADNPGDAVRTRRLEGANWRVIRFWNNDVLSNPEGVAATIAAALADEPSPRPSPVNGRGGKK